MKQKAVIFIGSQGSGKGTQADLLKKYLEENDSERGVFMFDTGTFLRALSKEDSFTSERMHTSLERGELQPVFLASYAWAKSLVEEFNGKDHVLIQGSPRTLLEADLMDQALRFFDITPTIVYLNVSEEAARGRLLGRGRSDDTEEAIMKRLGWFKDVVMPVVERYREKGEVVEVNADKAIEEVYEEMVTKLIA